MGFCWLKGHRYVNAVGILQYGRRDEYSREDLADKIRRPKVDVVRSLSDFILWLL